MSLCERIIALVFALGLLIAGTLNATAQNYEAALAGFTKDSFNDTDAAIGAVAASGNPLAVDVIQALQEGRLLFARREGLHPRQGRRDPRCRDRQARGGCARQSQPGAAQQSAAPLGRGGARWLDLARCRSGQALRGRAGGVQVARCECAADARCGAGKGDGRPREAGAERGARRGHPLSGERLPRTTSSTQ